MEPTTEYLLVLLIVLIVFAGLQISKFYGYLIRLNVSENNEEEKTACEPVEYEPNPVKTSSPKRGKSQKKTKTTKKVTNKKATSKKGKKK